VVVALVEPVPPEEVLVVVPPVVFGGVVVLVPPVLPVLPPVLPVPPVEGVEQLGGVPVWPLGHTNETLDAAPSVGLVAEPAYAALLPVRLKLAVPDPLLDAVKLICATNESVLTLLPRMAAAKVT
jgi:hypothetical protein